MRSIFPKKITLCFSCLVGLSCCVVSHAPFTGSSYSPVIVEKKKDLYITTAAWLLKYAKADITYALYDRLIVRGSLMTTYGLYQAEGSALFYHSIPKTTFYSGVLFNFQENNLKRKFSTMMFSNGKDYQYNCRYYSPGFVIGWQFFKQRYFSHEITSKVSYNIVGKYNYDYEHNNASAKQTGHAIFDNEHLSSKIPNFFSVEPSYTLIGKGSKRTYFLQLGFNFVEYTYRHNYQFLTSSYSKTLEDRSKLHPVHRSVNLTVGFIIPHPKAIQLNKINEDRL